MKLKPRRDEACSVHDARIDAALRLYGSATPAPDLESRVAARIAAAPHHPFQSKSFGLAGNSPTVQPWMNLLRGVSVGALAALAACAIVVGTVRHSQQAALPRAAVPVHSGGMSAAGGTHVPTHAIPQSPTIDPDAPRTVPRSRATVSRKPEAPGSQSPSSPPPSSTPHQ
jgi:hypothetical protein